MPKGIPRNGINIGHFTKGFTPWNKGKKYPQVTGKKNPNWKGGRQKIGNGYISIYKPEHLYNINNYVREHRFVIEQQIGRYLLPEEIGHHINEIKDDNRIENLMLFKNVMYHFWFHKKGSCNSKGIIFDGSKLIKIKKGFLNIYILSFWIITVLIFISIYILFIHFPDFMLADPQIPILN